MPRDFILGIITAASILVGAHAFAASFLYGWTVEVGGSEVCEDPYMNNATRTIECD
jgi:hypothetical protein